MTSKVLLTANNCSRREFLAESSCLVGSTIVGQKILLASDCSKSSAQDFLDMHSPAEQLNGLAQKSLAVAEASGASYSDIRLSYQHTLKVSLASGTVPVATIGTMIGYGVRAIVNGAMAFSYGNLPTTDAVVDVTKSAVLQARGISKLPFAKTALTPSRVVAGVWSTPYDVDPFAVPILEQGDLLGALNSVLFRTEGVTGSLGFVWEREARVCATSEGSLVTQTFLRAKHGLRVSANWLGYATLYMPQLRARHAGFEAVSNPILPELIDEYARYVKGYAQIPSKRLDVGRYPIVLDGDSMALVLANTLGPALQMDRVLGIEAEASGTSFVAQYEKVLGNQLFSPLMSVSADRRGTSLSGTKWDDECVESQSVSLVDEGCIHDFMTDRITSRALANWYQKRGIPLQSNGYAVAPRIDRPVMIGGGHLHMTPGQSRVPVEELYRDIKHGLFMLQGRGIDSDQQLASGLINSNSCLLLEIKNGRIVSHVKGAGLQFKTVPFLKSIVAVGDSSTVGWVSTSRDKGQPWQSIYADASAPAAAFKSVDVVSLA